MKGLDSNPNADDNPPSKLVASAAEPKGSEPKGSEPDALEAKVIETEVAQATGFQVNVLEPEAVVANALVSDLSHDTSLTNDLDRENSVKTKLPVTRLSLITATTVSWTSFACLTYVCEQEQYMQNLGISYVVYFATYYTTYFSLRYFEK